MNALPAMGLVLVLLGAPACSAAQVAPVPVYQHVELNDDAWREGEKTNVRPSREVLDASWQHHDGYLLWSGSGAEAQLITPEFDDDAVMQVFNDVFFGDLSPYMSKTVRCDCTGERFERNGVQFFLVREARLFAE